MVINCKHLNDNTYEDQLINCIQNVNIFSKFDSKLGFWQIKMSDDSISCTAFSCPEGHFE